MSDPKRPARRGFDPRLLEGSIARSLFLLAVPIMGANILQVAYQVIDAFWVGRLGAAAVAAVSVTMPIMFVLIAAGMGFAIAGTTLIAQYTGARDHAMVDHVAAQTLLTIVAVSVVLGAIGFLLAPPLLHLMGVAPAVYDGALPFMRVVFVALPFTFIYAMAQALMRGVGEVKAPLYIVAGTVFMNFCLDPVLIFGKFGAPAWGVTGAAIATLISQAIAAAIALRLLFGGRYGIHIHWRDFVPDFAFVKRAFLLGYPASIEQSARGIGMTVMTFFIASFGTVVTASFGVGVNVFNVVLIPAMGFSMATSTLVGQNIGAGNIGRAEQVARLAAIITFAMLSAFGLLCVVFAPGHRRDLRARRSRRHRRRRALYPHRVVELRLRRPAIRAAGRAARGWRDDPRHDDQPHLAMAVAASGRLHSGGAFPHGRERPLLVLAGRQCGDVHHRRALVRPRHLENPPPRSPFAHRARAGRGRGTGADVRPDSSACGTTSENYYRLKLEIAFAPKKSPPPSPFRTAKTFPQDFAKRTINRPRNHRIRAGSLSLPNDSHRCVGTLGPG